MRASSMKDLLIKVLRYPWMRNMRRSLTLAFAGLSFLMLSNLAFATYCNGPGVEVDTWVGSCGLNKITCVWPCGTGQTVNAVSASCGNYSSYSCSGSITTYPSCVAAYSSGAGAQTNSAGALSGCSTTAGVTTCSQSKLAGCTAKGCSPASTTLTCTAPTCTGNATLNTSTAACSCPTGYSLNSVGTGCNTVCLSPATQLGSGCQCPTNYTLNSAGNGCTINCVSPNAIDNSTGTACSCLNANYSLDPTGIMCLINCESPAYPATTDGLATQCLCPNNMTATTDSTKLAAGTSAYNNSCTCIAPLVTNSTGNACVQPTSLTGLGALGLSGNNMYKQTQSAASGIHGYVYDSGINVVSVTVGPGQYLGTIQVIPSSGKQCETGTNPRSIVSLSSVEADSNSDAFNNITLYQVNNGTSPTGYTDVPHPVTVTSGAGYQIYYNMVLGMGSVAYSAGTKATAAIAWTIFCVPGFTASYPAPTQTSTPLAITGWSSTTN